MGKQIHREEKVAKTVQQGGHSSEIRDLLVRPGVPELGAKIEEVRGPTTAERNPISKEFQG